MAWAPWSIQNGDSVEAGWARAEDVGSVCHLVHGSSTKPYPLRAQRALREACSDAGVYVMRPARTGGPVLAALWFAPLSVPSAGKALTSEFVKVFVQPALRGMKTVSLLTQVAVLDRLGPNFDAHSPQSVYVRIPSSTCGNAPPARMVQQALTSVGFRDEGPVVVDSASLGNAVDYLAKPSERVVAARHYVCTQDALDEVILLLFQAEQNSRLKLERRGENFTLHVKLDPLLMDFVRSQALILASQGREVKVPSEPEQDWDEGEATQTPLADGQVIQAST